MGAHDGPGDWPASLSWPTPSRLLPAPAPTHPDETLTCTSAPRTPAPRSTAMPNWPARCTHEVRGPLAPLFSAWGDRAVPP